MSAVAAVSGGVSNLEVGLLTDAAPGLFGVATGILGGWLMPSVVGADDGNPGLDAVTFQGTSARGEWSTEGFPPGPWVDPKLEFPAIPPQRDDWLYGTPLSLQTPITTNFPGVDAPSWRSTGTTFPATGTATARDGIYISKSSERDAALERKWLSREAATTYREGTAPPTNAEHTTGLNVSIDHFIETSGVNHLTGSNPDDAIFGDPVITGDATNTYFPRSTFVIHGHSTERRLAIDSVHPYWLSGVEDDPDLPYLHSGLNIKHVIDAIDEMQPNWLQDRQSYLLKRHIAAPFSVIFNRAELQGKTAANWVMRQGDEPLQQGMGIWLDGCSTGQMIDSLRLGQPGVAKDPTNTEFLLPSFAHQFGVQGWVIPDVYGLESGVFFRRAFPGGNPPHPMLQKFSDVAPEDQPNVLHIQYAPDLDKNGRLVVEGVERMLPSGATPFEQTKLMPLRDYIREITGK